MNNYIPVLIMMGAGVVVGTIAITVSQLIGPKFKHKMKDLPFECGVPSIGDTKHRVSVRFYLIAILFLLFDVEAIFFFPWAVVFRDYLRVGGTFIIWEMAAFLAVLLIGFFYILGKGALEWD